ncbi:MAG TPA: hypothetical protein PL176_04690 [Kiritimatiellia bacterium]|jgi:hypothetical protein|nr:MAG: hypothetical protein BWX70_00604 [Verrucomicrobia bacterium ADurb.Bin070]HPO37280.1 hypothetical protein [Kiritimatiellia bacterium]HQL51784.1 hypothetical protein [Kiritimatiellia bacterium]
MVWCAEQRRKIRRAALAAVAVCVAQTAAAAEDPEVARWFNRHDDAAWQPLAARWPAAKAAMTAPVENLALPLDYHADGRIRARLRAKKAQVFADGMIFAEGVEVELLTAEGQPDGTLTAEGCLFDREARHGYCDGRVTVEKDGDRLKGRGMYFSMAGEYIKIMAECEIRTHRIRNNFGRF